MPGRDRLAPVRLFLSGPARTKHKPTWKAQKPFLPHRIALGTRQYGQAGV